VGRFNAGVDLEYRLRLDKFKKELAEIPGLTKKNARAMTRDWVRAQRDMDRESKRAARSSQRAWSQASGQMTGVIDELVPGFSRLTGAASGVGASLAVIGAATAAVGILVKLGKEAAKTRAEIRALNQVTGLLPETLAAIEFAGGAKLLGKMGEAAGEFQKRIVDASQGTGEALKAFDRLGISVTDADGRIRATDSVLREFVARTQEVGSATEQAALFTSALGGAGRELAASLGSTSLGEWVDHAERFGVDVGPAAITASQQWAMANWTLTTTLNDVFRAVESLSAGGFADFAEKTAIGVFGAVQYLQAAGEVAWDAVSVWGYRLGTVATFLSTGVWDTTLVDQAAADANEIQSELDKAEIAIRDFFAARASMIEAAGTVGRDTPPPTFGQAPGATSGAPSEATAGAGDVVADAKRRAEEVADAEIEAAQRAAAEINRTYYNRDSNAAELHRRNMERNEAAASAAGQVTDVMGEMFGSMYSLIEKSSKGATKEQKEQLLALFYAQKAAGIASSIIFTALAIGQAIGSVPYPANIAAAIASGLTGTTQTVMIAATPPPSFHVGGSVAPGGYQPDERGAKLLTGEGVLSRQGMTALDRLNRGESGGGGGVVAVFGHRVYDDIEAARIKIPDSTFARALRAQRGSRVGHRGR